MKPLKGKLVVSICANLPGPVTAHKLKELGATVIKIDPPAGDPMKLHYREYYDYLADKQKVVTLDLKSEKGREKLFKLLKKADLFLTASRAQSLKKMGLDWPPIRKKFKKLSYISILGYSGKDRDLSGHDLNFQAAAGLIVPPTMPALCVADMAGAQEAVITALSMLLKKSNRGTYREISLFDAAKYFSHTIHFKLSGPKSLLNGKNPRYRLYEAAQGWIALAALENHYWGRLCGGLGLNDPEAADLEKSFKEKSAAEWETWARKLDIPLMEVKEDVWA